MSIAFFAFAMAVIFAILAFVFGTYRNTLLGVAFAFLLLAVGLAIFGGSLRGAV